MSAPDTNRPDAHALQLAVAETNERLRAALREIADSQADDPPEQGWTGGTQYNWARETARAALAAEHPDAVHTRALVVRRALRVLADQGFEAEAEAARAKFEALLADEALGRVTTVDFLARSTEILRTSLTAADLDSPTVESAP